ncbi:MAG: type I DNA topoisomerase [Bacteroidales bacterium]|nr:type I DNA topoisomerase [Bacteroidales bacterium]
MSNNLVIVESPAKAKTIEKFLGKDYKVLSSFGHVRDLPQKTLSVDVGSTFEPKYVVSADKKKLVGELQKASDSADMVWLASDEDREGEAISWHLAQVLEIPQEKIKRIVFNEITKSAILNAIEHPRAIDLHLVMAQQARRVLDRIVGYEISPVLWKKVKTGLSAGRVQSVAVRLIVEKENEIRNFVQTSSYKVLALFLTSDNKHFKAELNKRFDTKEDALKFLNDSNLSEFTIAGVDTKATKRNPAPPFTTSTLQQETSRKLGFSVSRTMSVAQQLYEGGFITYMRTDSVTLSSLALNTSANFIKSHFGEEYYQKRQYATKSKGAQEAHEAIRPVYIDNQEITSSNRDMQRLYELIWKRTLASQMTDAKFDKTTVNIDISNRKEKFQANGEVLLFDGFLKLYTESKEEENNDANDSVEILPAIKVGDKLNFDNLVSKLTFTNPPYRYSEASLVKKLEELGIGRPSTYAPTISTIQKREYVVKGDKPAQEREYVFLENKKGKISEKLLKEKFASEKGKLLPTDIGMLVNQFMVENFNKVVDYNFTANVEEEFDKIAEGNLVWNKMLAGFYKKFHAEVESATANAEKMKGERLVGIDTASGKNVYVKIGRFGPMAQIGEATDKEKPQFASLKKDQMIDSITLEEVLDLFKLPRKVGEFEGEDMTAAVGRFGPYIKHGKSFYSIPKTLDPMIISSDEAIQLINEKRNAETNKIIYSFENDNIQVINGRYGPYISHDKANYKIPKSVDASKMTLEDVKKIISDEGNKTHSSKKRK